MGSLSSRTPKPRKSRAATKRKATTRKLVVVRTPTCLGQIAPYDLARKVRPAPPGSLKPLAREIELSNTFGDAL